MTEREKAFLLYGFVTGIKSTGDFKIAYETLGRAMFGGVEPVELMMEAKAETDPYYSVAFGAPIEGSLWTGARKRDA